MHSAGIALGESVEIWLDLLQNSPKSCAQAVGKVQARADQTISSPVLLLASELDRCFCGQQLNQKHHAEVCWYEMFRTGMYVC